MKLSTSKLCYKTPPGSLHGSHCQKLIDVLLEHVRCVIHSVRNAFLMFNLCLIFTVFSFQLSFSSSTALYAMGGSRNLAVMASYFPTGVIAHRLQPDMRLFYDSFCALLTLSLSDFNRAELISFPVVMKQFTDNGMKSSCFCPQDRFSEVFLQVCGLDTRLEGRWMAFLLSLMQLVSAYSSMGFIHSEPEEERRLRRLLSLGTWRPLGT